MRKNLLRQLGKRGDGSRQQLGRRVSQDIDKARHSLLRHDLRRIRRVVVLNERSNKVKNGRKVGVVVAKYQRVSSGQALDCCKSQSVCRVEEEASQLQNERG